jgi:hypothetical protein
MWRFLFDIFELIFCFSDRDSPWRTILWIVILIVGAVSLWQYFHQTPPTPAIYPK